jgi:hypothetical protein
MSGTGESNSEHRDQKYVVRKDHGRGTLPLTYRPLERVVAGEAQMKLRTLFLAAVALVVLAGAVVPASAKSHHHRHHRHHHHR